MPKPAPAAFLESAKGQPSIERGFGPAPSGWPIVAVGPQCWRNRMTECMLALMSKDRKTASLVTVVLLLSGLSLGDCATSTAARAEETAAPRQGVYPQVQDLPPKPEKPVMTADERAKLLNELTAARDRRRLRLKPERALHALSP